MYGLNRSRQHRKIKKLVKKWDTVQRVVCFPGFSDAHPQSETADTTFSLFEFIDRSKVIFKK